MSWRAKLRLGGACAVVAAALLLLAAPATCLAQNAAETTKSSKDDSTAKNTAEKPRRAKPAPPPQPPEETPADPAPEPGTKAGAAEDVVVQGAEAGPVGPTPTEAPADSAAPADNVAEGAVPATGASTPPPVNVPGERPMPPSYYEKLNTAEGRPSGGAASNAAEGGSLSADSTKAIPPEPPFELPAPDALAGSAQGYKPPTIELHVPGLDAIPTPPADSTYIQPNREYVKDRPLPPLDVDETDEERIARNIEESLKQINLTVETRPDSKIQIPLPSGTITFKAADAFQFDRRNRILTFIGNAEIVFDDVAVWADRIEVNDSAAMAYAKGYVAVQQRDEIIYADEMYLNYDTKTLELFYVEGNTSGPRMKGRAYYTADRAYGTFDRLIMEKCEVTTCDPFCGSVDEAHLSAHKAVYKRNTSIVLHDVYMYVRSHKIGYIPLLAMPIPREQRYEQEQSDVQQNYGYSDAEGMFAKFAYTYSTRWVDGVNSPLLGAVKLEMMQNRGAKFGIRQDFYSQALGVTSIRAEYGQDWPEAVATGLFGRKKANAGKDQVFKFYQELNFSQALHGSLRVERINSFTGASSIYNSGNRTNTWTSNFDLAYTKDKVNIALSGRQNTTITGGNTLGDGTVQPTTESSNASANFKADIKMSKEADFNFTETYTANKGAAGREGLPANTEGSILMNLNWTGGQKTKWHGYSIKGKYQESAIDWDRDKNTTDNTINIQKDLPSVLVTLPNDLLGDGNYFNRFDFELNNLVTGRRRSPASIFRSRAGFGGGDRISFSRSSNLDTRFSFDQYWYDDGNRQYALRPSLTYSYDTFDWFKLDAGWNLQFHQGVRIPPYSSDNITYSQTLNYGLTFTNRRSWRAQLRSSYDLGRDNMNPISATFEWDPNSTFGLRASTSLKYDINTVNYTVDGVQQSRKLKRFRFAPLSIQSTIRSPYTTPEGFRNWQLNIGFENDMEDGFRTTRLSTTYYRRYDHGWSGVFTGGFRAGSDPPPDFSEKFFRNYVKRIALRKTNCCTTIEGGWLAEGHQFYVSMYLNALPQYPGMTNIYRTSTTSAEGTKYEYLPQFLFPINPVMQDILQDQFGISGTTASLLQGAAGF